MLVLSRKVDESIIIGDAEILFKIVEIQGDKVRIGIETKDPKVAVHRHEVYNKIKNAGLPLEHVEKQGR